MPVSDKDARILFQKSGNRCAFPRCGRILTYSDGASDTEISLSDIAHIVAESNDGPRGNHHMDLSERNRVSNLVLLCKECHRKIDNQPATFPVERLRRFKEDHERLIEKATAQATAAAAVPNGYIEKETLYSTLLPVLRLPRYVYSAQTSKRYEKEIRDLIQRPADRHIIYPFILRGDRLYCFNDPSKDDNPFRDAVDTGAWDRHSSSEWWLVDDQRRWFNELLNRSLNKLTGRRDLMLDREHRRYYFSPIEKDKGKPEPRKVSYRPLNRNRAERSVVWQPIRKKTGEKKNFWYHLAVSLEFRRASKISWALSVRPELRVTRDGFTPLDSDRIGSKVTKKKAHAFNNDLLEDLQFWRSFLSDGQPRIILPYGGGQQLIISSSMLEGQVEWPGMPEKFKLSFQNTDFVEDLFSLAEITALDEEYEDDQFQDDDAEI